MCFKKINAVIEPGKFYVIVGANGAGKTTFIHLLMRLYDPIEGEIKLNHTNIKEYDFQKYRDCFGAVLQNYKVYDYSILENITMCEQANDKIIEKANIALTKAGVMNKVLSLEDGIHTPIGRAFDDKGVNLSGGEYQKIALAKALYRNAAILILDEPSSALDAFSEDDLIQTFKNASENKTVFYISHRLSVAKYAYKVLFINNGRLEGFDNHENLLKSCPLYNQMYTVQAKHYITGADK